MAAKKAANTTTTYFVRQEGYSDGAEVDASSPAAAVRYAVEEGLLADDGSRYHVYELVSTVLRAISYTEEG